MRCGSSARLLLTRRRHRLSHVANCWLFSVFLVAAGLHVNCGHAPCARVRMFCALSLASEILMAVLASCGLTPFSTPCLSLKWYALSCASMSCIAAALQRRAHTYCACGRLLCEKDALVMARGNNRSVSSSRNCNDAVCASSSRLIRVIAVASDVSCVVTEPATHAANVLGSCAQYTIIATIETCACSRTVSV